MAIDRNALMNAVEAGAGLAATNTFDTTSPYYDKAYDYPATNKVLGQQLLDQVFAETGKDVEFTIMACSCNGYGTYLQAALQSYNHLKVTMNLVAAALVPEKASGGGFDVTQRSFTFIDPTPTFASDHPDRIDES